MIFLWGSNARETHPIFFHHVLKAVHAGARLFTVDPRRTGSAQWADAWLGIDVGTDVALSNTMAREILHAGLAQPRVHRARDDRIRRVRRLGRAVDARAGRARDRRPRRGDPRRRPRLRARRPGDHLLDARHHRAPQRRRQRLRAHQPRAPHRPRRPLRLGAEPAPRPEQRAGRRRHGRDPEQAPRLPGHRARRRGPREVRAGLGHHDPAPLRLAPDADVRGDGARRAAHALRRRREPGPVRGRREAHEEAARGARPPGRAGHLPHQDRRAGRRRAAGLGELVRGRGHRHEQRAARPAGAKGARPARPGPRRHRDRLRHRRPHGARPRPRPTPSRSGPSCARSRRCTPA